MLRRRSMVLITGGSGFVGANLADRLAASGERVLIYDKLSRPNVVANLEWLQQRHGHRIETAIADVRDADALRDTIREASAVFHLAAQASPLSLDFLRARTLNVLEAARRRPDPPPLVFASTNKVYGELFEAARLLEERSRYRPGNGMPLAVGEGWPIALCSPNGCSKGAADAYVLDYARVFGLRTVVFRMSCLYGPRQLGTEYQVVALPAGAARRADHDLRGRQAGTRSAVHRRRCRCLRACVHAHGRPGRAGVQSWRRPPQRRQPAGAPGALCRARRPGAAGPLRRLASRRSALLRI